MFAVTAVLKGLSSGDTIFDMNDVNLLFTLSLIIYSDTNGRPARKAAVRIAGAALLMPVAIYGLARLAGAGAHIALSKPDYYEDVLVATETAFEKRREIAEGRCTAATCPRSWGRRLGRSAGGRGGLRRPTKTMPQGIHTS
jgi:hypothetical protein